MFKAKGSVFGKVPCPDLANDGKCTVLNCLFGHDRSKRRSSIAEPPQKRPKHTEPQPIARVESEKTPEPKDVLFVVPKALSSGVLIPRVERLQNTKKISAHVSSKGLCNTPNTFAIKKEYEIALESASLAKYRESIASYLGTQGSRTPTKDLTVVRPIDMNSSPALLPVRRKFIQLLVEAIKRANPACKVPLWTATDEEFKIASTNGSTTYQVAIKKKLYELNHPERVPKAFQKAFTLKDYIDQLRLLCIDREKLIRFGFIMDFPEPIDSPEETRQCHRCKEEFKLSRAGNDYDCRYHSGKVVKTDLRERIYLCCGGVVGATDTEPCAKSEHHVFYWSNPQERHHFLPYVKTSKLWGTRRGSLEAVGIDCEMGFTTEGFELLRITAIDFLTGEEVIDILVRPKGKVLDLNTRWSGVAEIKQEAMGFEDSIALLGEVIDANTVLIGHGLENDMNAMRIIHERIVDTAVLYPRHKATPTFRVSLKQLAFQYLGRNIQIGEHDSGEDSLAAIDVTKHFIEQDLERKRRSSM